jgi:hypothetical protein
MATEHHFKWDKMAKFYRHWNHRTGLETLKKYQADKYEMAMTGSEHREMEDELK